MTASLQDKVLAYLRDHHVMTLATYGMEDVWAAALFYVNDGVMLYFLSSPNSRHGQNLTDHPRVSVTIQEDYSDWPEIKGIQLEGLATLITGHEETKARALYGAKFPVVGKLAKAPAVIVKAMAKVRWYKIVPDRLYFIDNAVAFGHRDQLPCPDNPSKGR